MTHYPETGTRKPVPVSYRCVMQFDTDFSGTKIWYGLEHCSTPWRKLVQVFCYRFLVLDSVSWA